MPVYPDRFLKLQRLFLFAKVQVAATMQEPELYFWQAGMSVCLGDKNLICLNRFA
jgi:hypothetical protein